MFNQAIHLPTKPVFLPGPSTLSSEEKAVDKEFRRFYVRRNLLVTRVALSAAFWLVLAISLLDTYLMPDVFAGQVFGLRMWTMLIPLLAALGGTFLVKEQLWIPYVAASAALLVGVASIVVAGIAAREGMPLTLWGTLFITVCTYLVLGLSLRQSMAVGWPIFAVYTSFGLVSGWPLQTLVYGAVFLGVANVIGTWAAYRLERNAREIFEGRRELARQSRTDGFTGLYNRRTFDEHLRQTWKQARRDQKKIAIAVVDIDHFKLYNDCYGHKKGDECIKAIADVLAESVNRPLDIVARYGGEEYVLMLFDPSPSFLESFTRSLCHKVVDLDIEHKAAAATPSISVSIGASITDANGSLKPEQLLRQADDALYEAKMQGRNQAIVYRTEWGQNTTANLAAVLT